MSKVKESLSEFWGTEYYESANVGRTRKSKTCNICNGIIPSGSSHKGYRFYGEDGDWPVFVVCNDCESKHSKDLHLIEKHKA